MNQDVKALEEALAKGPTAGEWRLVNWDEFGWFIDTPRNKCDVFVKDGEIELNRATGRTPDQDFADISYLFACHPDRIRRLLDYIRKLEQEVANGK